MTNEESTGASGGGRTPRQGIGGSPVGSTLSIILAVIAVVAGFLILRNITDDGGSDSDSAGVGAETDGGDASGDADVSSTDVAGGAGQPTTTAASEPATTEPLVTEGATVVVANANTVGGSAGRMSTALEALGFTMGEPANATVQRQRSVVQYDASVASAEAVADSVARVLGGVNVREMPTPQAVEGGDVGDAGVLLLLGENEADKTLRQLQREANQGDASQAPEPSGSVAGTDAETDDSVEDTVEE